jgi:hypothetical protein
MGFVRREEASGSSGTPVVCDAASFGASMGADWTR